MIPIANALVVAALGVAAFRFFSLPLPWLLGPIFACLIAAAMQVPLGGVKALNDSMRTVLGVAVGATLTPAVIATFPAMWPTLCLVPVMVLCVCVLGVPYFQRLCGYDFPTAYYAAMPGGLQDMILFGEEAGGNVRSLGLIHATRVLVIVVALPFILKGIWDADLSSLPGVRARNVPAHEMAIMVVCAVVGWLGAKRLGLFGASILGPLILAGIVTVAGGLHHRPPTEAISAAQFFIGMSIGSKYTGITMVEVRRDLMAGLGFCLILILLTLIFVEMIYGLDLAPGREALLSFAPGGQAELTILALIVGADVAFVVAHHLLRIFVVILGAPLAARYFNPKGPTR
ncbi:MAG: AbrB family transcriptional regulator [Silicimonas sp.]|nr:AbrB family transcriptional regulator [Silicimonas sp.]